MCCHSKPTRNDEEYNDLDFRAPEIEEGDTILFDECGRCSPQVNGKGGTDYHSHHFRFVNAKYGGYFLLVRHGGGDERLSMGYEHTRLAEVLALLPDSDTRYLMLHALYNTFKTGARQATEKERQEWQVAARDKRIKTRKLPRQGFVKVWIEKAVSHEA
jgi:hypothetical protein